MSTWLIHLHKPKLGTMKWGLSLRDLFLFLCLCYLTCVGPRFQTLTGEVDISSSFVNLWGFIGLISWLAFHTSDTRFWDSSLKFMAHTMPRINYFSMVFLPMKPSVSLHSAMAFCYRPFEFPPQRGSIQSWSA